MRWIGCAALAASLLGATTARAQDTGVDVSAETSADLALSTMRSQVHGYYQGERISAYIIGGIGIAGIGAGIPLVLQEGDFARGAGWSLIIVGALQAIGAVIYAFDVGGHIDHYTAALDRDPVAFREEETAHMDGTISRFILYQIIELALTLGGIGLATYGFVADEDTWAGIGVGVASLAFPLLVVDFINQRRGRAYAEHVRELAVPPAPSAAAPPPPPMAESLAPLARTAAAPSGFYFTVSRPF